MKTPFRRRLVANHLTYPTVLAILMFAAAALALPVHSLNSNSWLGAIKQDFPNDSVKSTTTFAAKVASYLGRTSTRRSSAVSTEATIATYAADCITARTTFYLGETVCAKTDGVTLPPAEQWWVNWILLSNNTVVHGGQGQTDVTTNPQTFTYAPTTTGSYKVSLTNLPNDISQLPAGFTVVAAPKLSTYSFDCTAAKTNFNLGETICIKVSGLSNDEFPRLRLQLSSPDNFALARFDITDNSQQFTHTLPGAISQTVSGQAINHVGNWRVSLIDTDANITDSVSVVVRKSGLLLDRFADLHVAKVFLGDPVEAGQPVSFRLVVANMGPDPATRITLTDVTLPNTTFHSFTRTSFGIAWNFIPDLKLNNPLVEQILFGRKSLLSEQFFTGYAGMASFRPTLMMLEDSPVSFTCQSPSPGQSGTTTCTTEGGQEFKPGETAVFTAVYTINANIADGAVLTDNASASINSETADPAPNSNNAAISGTASNPTPPSCTLSCPQNLTVTAAPGQTATAVTFDAPSTGGTCTSVSVVPASGSLFGVGTTVVTASTEDGQSCSFTVTVNAAEDNEAPTITCPSDIAVAESSSSANSATVTYNVTATDNSGSASVSCNPPSGSSFPIGTQEVVCTATDAAGNSASCTFNVTVNQVGCDLDANSPPPTPNVASLPTITRACSFTLLAADDPTATDACGATINGETSNERTYDVPGTYTVTWTYTDSAGHTATQNQTIIIQSDNTAPVPDAASLPTVTGECTAAITGDPPTASDNCGGSGIQGTPLDPLSYNTAGTYTVRWQFTDAAGNSSIQNQTVVVTDSHAPTVTLSGPSSVTIECHTSYTDAGATAADNCSPAPTPTSNSTVDVNIPGTYEVVWTATDGGGNTDSATRTVIVVDTIAPVISLNGASALTVECHTSFTDPGATASDSCDTNVPVNVSGAVNANVVGTYTLVYTAADDSGNAATSVSRTVNVVDTTAPTISCPANIVVSLPLNSTATSMPVTFTAPTASDSCDASVPVTTTHASGSVFSVGSTAVTASASDDSGNSASCTFTVTVLYNFAGFFNPVSNPPTLNNITAGRSVPLKFSLSGNKGLGIFAAGYPASQQITCDSSAPITELEGTDTPGGSTLSYSPDQYHYNWKTEPSWVGTCRILVVKLNDGSEHSALFKFK